MARKFKHFCLGLAATVCYRLANRKQAYRSGFCRKTGPFAWVPTELIEGANYRSVKGVQAWRPALTARRARTMFWTIKRELRGL
jgi:hypothetical protein